MFPFALDHFQETIGSFVAEFGLRQTRAGSLSNQTFEGANGRRRRLLLTRKTHLLGRANFIVKPHRLGAKNPFVGCDRHEVLLASHHERRDARPTGFFHRFREQMVCSRRACGSKEITAFEVETGNTALFDEPAKIDVAGTLGGEPFELFVGDLNKSILPDLVTSNDVLSVQIVSRFFRVIAPGQRFTVGPSILRETLLPRFAGNRFTGMLTRPNVIVPDQKGRDTSFRSSLSSGNGLLLASAVRRLQARGKGSTSDFVSPPRFGIAWSLCFRPLAFASMYLSTRSRYSSE